MPTFPNARNFDASKSTFNDISGDLVTTNYNDKVYNFDGNSKNEQTTYNGNVSFNNRHFSGNAIHNEGNTTNNTMNTGNSFNMNGGLDAMQELLNQHWRNASSQPRPRAPQPHPSSSYGTSHTFTSTPSQGFSPQVPNNNITGTPPSGSLLSENTNSPSGLNTSDDMQTPSTETYATSNETP